MRERFRLRTLIVTCLLLWLAIVEVQQVLGDNSRGHGESTGLEGPQGKNEHRQLERKEEEDEGRRRDKERKAPPDHHPNANDERDREHGDGRTQRRPPADKNNEPDGTDRGERVEQLIRQAQTLMHNRRPRDLSQHERRELALIMQELTRLLDKVPTDKHPANCACQYHMDHAFSQAARQEMAGKEQGQAPNDTRPSSNNNNDADKRTPPPQPSQPSPPPPTSRNPPPQGDGDRQRSGEREPPKTGHQDKKRRWSLYLPFSGVMSEFAIHFLVGFIILATLAITTTFMFVRYRRLRRGRGRGDQEKGGSPSPCKNDHTNASAPTILCVD